MGSMVNTLVKLAVGYAVTRGVKSVIGGGGTTSRAGGGARGGAGGGLLGQIIGAATGGSGSRSGGGIGGLVGGSNKGSGLEGIMDGLLKGKSNAGTQGGLGDILGQLGGSAVGRKSGGSLGGLGDLLNQSLGGGGQLNSQPTDDEEDAAELLIRAMLQAAKADGRVDEEEKAKLLGNIGELSQDEVTFINGELSRGIDIDGLVRETPRGMESQVYMMSLMGIDLDNQNEAQYLNDLAQSYGMKPNDVNRVHEMMGVQPLYS